MDAIIDLTDTAPGLEGFMESYPSKDATRVAVVEWLNSWFTDRDLARSVKLSDRMLYTILDSLPQEYDGGFFNGPMVTRKRLEEDFMNAGMAMYCADRLIEDILAAIHHKVCVVPRLLLILD